MRLTVKERKKATAIIAPRFFQSTMKLIEKTRIGSKITKKYDKAQTPYRRVLACPDVSSGDKQALKDLYAKLNPAQLKRQITKLQEKLIRLNTMKKSPKMKTAV